MGPLRIWPYPLMNLMYLMLAYIMERMNIKDNSPNSVPLPQEIVVRPRSINSLTDYLQARQVSLMQQGFLGGYDKIYRLKPMKLKGGYEVFTIPGPARISDMVIITNTPNFSFRTVVDGYEESYTYQDAKDNSTYVEYFDVLEDPDKGLYSIRFSDIGFRDEFKMFLDLKEEATVAGYAKVKTLTS